MACCDIRVCCVCFFLVFRVLQFMFILWFWEFSVKWIVWNEKKKWKLFISLFALNFLLQIDTARWLRDGEWNAKVVGLVVWHERDETTGEETFVLANDGDIILMKPEFASNYIRKGWRWRNRFVFEVEGFRMDEGVMKTRLWELRCVDLTNVDEVNICLYLFV